MYEEFIERRKHARLNLSMKVDYKVSSTGGEQKTTLSRDMSLGGVLLLVSEKMDAGTPLELEIYLSGEDSKPVKTRGEVIWQGELGERGEGYYHTGIAFSGIVEEDKKRFAEFCFSQMYEMVGLPDWPTKR